jgi:tight adherence protein B
MSLIGLAAAGAGLAAGLALSVPANAGLDALAWRRRARSLPRRGSVSVLRRSAAAPLLRQTHAGEARLARHLPGTAAALALAGVRAAPVATAALLLALAGLALGLAAGLPVLLALLLVPPAGLLLLILLARGLARRARRRFERGFPDALALLIRALRAGQPVPAALAEVARSSTGPVAGAFAGAVEAMSLGAPVESALRSAAHTLGSGEFDLLVTTIALQRETGGNLAASLLTLDDTLRQRRLLVLKGRAMSAEARTSALIIAAMPFAMAALMAAVSPDYLVPLFTTRLGKALILAGLASLATGGVIIGQMMRVKT